jgi:hypothetical protein
LIEQDLGFWLLDFGLAFKGGFEGLKQFVSPWRGRKQSLSFGG